MQGPSGVPEDSLELHAASWSPLFSAVLESRKVGQSLTVAKLCERKLCGTLRSVFFGEKKPTQDLLATEASIGGGNSGHIQYWVEILDYVGDVDFHGFIVEDEKGKTMFTFLKASDQHKELKPG